MRELVHPEKPNVWYESFVGQFLSAGFVCGSYSEVGGLVLYFAILISISTADTKYLH